MDPTDILRFQQKAREARERARRAYENAQRARDRAAELRLITDDHIRRMKARWEAAS